MSLFIRRLILDFFYSLDVVWKAVLQEDDENKMCRNNLQRLIPTTFQRGEEVMKMFLEEIG